MRFSKSLLLFAAILAQLCVVASAWGINNCVQCHSALGKERLRAPAREHASSVHQHDAIGCIGCHGGDAADPTVRAHEQPDFASQPKRGDIAKICGGCHGDARFVRNFNASIPIDQLTLFSMSKHGRAVADGVSAAPTCTTCHGSHAIFRSDDERSSVHESRIAGLCGDCHQDADKLASTKLPTDQLSKWRRSAHGQAFAAGTRNAPTCVGCHGSHGELSTASTAIGRVCGTCHREQLGYFERSPHSGAFQRLGFSECVPCHGSHDVVRSNPLLLGMGPDGACAKCHAKAEKPRVVAETISRMLTQTRQRAAAARKSLRAARQQGLSVAGSTRALAELDTAETLMLPVVHTVRENEVRAALASVDSASTALEHLVNEAHRTLRAQRSGYFVALAFLLLLAGLLTAKVVQLGRGRP